MDTTPFPNAAEDTVTEPSYDGDVVAWANEQARRLRAGEFHRLDIEHIADEIEDVGKSEQQELVNRVALLIAHLLKWHYQPGHRSRSWENTIREQRRRCQRRLKKTPQASGRNADGRGVGGRNVVRRCVDRAARDRPG